MIENLSLGEIRGILTFATFRTVLHAGFGLERAVQFITGMENIRDVISFPRTPGSAEF